MPRQSTRIFTFGIGTDVNTHLLDRIASETRAVSQYVLPEEDIEVKVSSFYSKIRDPVLSNLALAFTNPSIRVTQLQPSTLPDLFNGDMLVVFGRYSGSGAAAVKIRDVQRKAARVRGGRQLSCTDVRAIRSFPQLWATRRVGWLLDEMRMHGESSELQGRGDPPLAGFRDRHAVHGLPRAGGRGAPQRPGEPALVPGDGEGPGRDGQREARLDSVRREAASEASRAGASAVENSMAMQDMKSVTNRAAGRARAGLAKKAPAP